MALTFVAIRNPINPPCSFLPCGFSILRKTGLNAENHFSAFIKFLSGVSSGKSITGVACGKQSFLCDHRLRPIK
jgi:hypothetical protein